MINLKIELLNPIHWYNLWVGFNFFSGMVAYFDKNLNDYINLLSVRKYLQYHKVFDR